MDEFEEILRLNALREEIIKRYEAGERNFTGIDLRYISISYPCFMDVNFSSVNLEESVFNAIYLVNTSFSCANLEKAAFPTSLINCNFSNTNLRKADFRGANLIRTNLTGADLTGANLSRSVLIDTNLTGTNLTDIKIDKRTIFVSIIMPDGSMRTESIKQIIDAQQLRQRFYVGWENDFQDIIIHNADLSCSS